MTRSTKRTLIVVGAAFLLGGLILPNLTVKWEPPAGGIPPRGIPEGDLFPHIYGPINLDAVVQVVDLQSNPDGKYKLPDS